MITRQLQGKAKVQVSKWLLCLYRVVWIIGISVFILVESRVVISMNTEAKDNLDYVIVLGAGVRGTTPTRPLRLRIQKAYEYMTENPDTILIASGGKGRDEQISEAACIRNELVEMGIEKSRILIEDKSRDTEENIRNSFLIIPEEAEVGIVTNGFHIYRSVGIAKGQGHEKVSGVPAPTLMPVGIHYVVREFFGVVKWKFSA